MKLLSGTKRAEAGFTLIELMIVVGIIGILVAIAAPNFSRYQSKARQSEAKLALAAIYSGEKSFNSEYAAYIGSFDAIGYAPEGAKRFYSVGWTGSGGTITGFTGSTANYNWININNSFICSQTSPDYGAALGNDSQTFLVSASGCIRNGQTNMDDWNINDVKAISNNYIAL